MSKQKNKAGEHKTTYDEKQYLLKKLTQQEKMGTAVIIWKNRKTANKMLKIIMF